MIASRLAHELGLIAEGNLISTIEKGSDGRDFVLYRDVPTRGPLRGLPSVQDVIVPVPSGYPAAHIDLAGLPVGSPLMSLVKGGNNSQGTVHVAGVQWELASYHPHQNGGGPPWDPSIHGFHTYVDHLIAWLALLN